MMKYQLIHFLEINTKKSILLQFSNKNWQISFMIIENTTPIYLRDGFENSDFRFSHISRKIIFSFVFVNWFYNLFLYFSLYFNLTLFLNTKRVEEGLSESINKYQEKLVLVIDNKKVDFSKKKKNKTIRK